MYVLIALATGGHSSGRVIGRAFRAALWAATALAAVLGCSTAALGRASEGGHGSWPGLYELNRMLTFYVVNDAPSNFTATIYWQNTQQASEDTPVMVRVLDPDERVVARVFDPGLRVTGSTLWHTIVIPVTVVAGGVYQVIVTGFGGMVEFTISPQLAWGVYGYPFLAGLDHLSDAYVFLPPNLPNLSVQCTGAIGSLTLTDAGGITHLSISGANASGYCVLPAGDNQVWRLAVQAPLDYGVNFGVAPIIVCPDQATALAIHSSIDVLADGTICFHKFQVAAHDVLQTYRALDASSFLVTPPNFGAASAAWTSAPPRTSLLLGPYGVYSTLPPTLAEQNLNPVSPWFGCIRVWHDENGAERPNPWTTYSRLDLTDPAPTMSCLAAIYAIDDPVNPLHHNPNLRNRVIIAALQQMMMLREHELPESTYTDYDGGTKAFDFPAFGRGFPWAVEDCPSEVRAVWIDGMRRYTDHMVISAVPEVVNQWSFIMLGLQYFAKATGEQEYRDYVQMHIHWLLTRNHLGNGAMPAGYFSETEGPDATYSGLHLHNLAWLCEDTGNAPLKQALIACFRLFNHTIAPEPDGSWLGASSFCHRTPGDWTVPQSTAGVGILADDSPEVAVKLGHSWIPWAPPHGPGEAAYQQQQLQFLLHYYPADAYDDPVVGPCIPGGPIVHMAIWEHFMGTPPAGQLPVKASERFTRKFGDEFLCVRRPSYYAFLYCGKRYEIWRAPGAPDDPNVQYPRNGGGLSMFWSPRFGSSILAKNWSAYSTNSIIATTGNQAFFEDYWTVDSGLNAAQARATISGELTDGRMAFRRQLNFLEDRITCEIRLTAQQALNYNRLWECFPYPLDKPDAISVTLHDADGKQINGNNKIASAIVFRSAANEAHVIAFSQPRRCDIGSNTSTDDYGGQREIGRVLTQLPDDWNANQTRTVKWAMRAVRPNQVQATIKQMVASLH